MLIYGKCGIGGIKGTVLMIQMILISNIRDLGLSIRKFLMLLSIQHSLSYYIPFILKIKHLIQEENNMTVYYPDYKEG
jgi:hypothetical protein